MKMLGATAAAYFTLLALRAPSEYDSGALYRSSYPSSHARLWRHPWAVCLLLPLVTLVTSSCPVLLPSPRLPPLSVSAPPALPSDGLMSAVRRWRSAGRGQPLGSARGSARPGPARLADRAATARRSTSSTAVRRTRVRRRRRSSTTSTAATAPRRATTARRRRRPRRPSRRSRSRARCHRPPLRLCRTCSIRSSSSTITNHSSISSRSRSSRSRAVWRTSLSSCSISQTRSHSRSRTSAPNNRWVTIPAPGRSC